MDQRDPADDAPPLPATAVRERMELLVDLGCGLLESGLTGAQVARELERRAVPLGIPDLECTTFGRVLSLEAALPDGGSVSVTRAARALDLIDCTRSRALIETAETAGVRGADDGERSGEHSACDDGLATARERVQRLRDTATPWWVVTLGMTMLAFFISMQVGVGWRAWVSAAAVQLASSAVGVALARLQPPKLLAVAVQSSAAGALATLLVQLGFVDPVGAAAAIAVNWLLLLPLPQVIGAVTDAVEADYISALSRVATVGVAALGICIGGALTFALGEMLDMAHPRLDALPSFPWYLVLVFSALGAIANAFANGGRAPLALPAAGLGAVTGAVNQLLLLLAGLPILWASSLAALALGVASTILAARTGYPQQVLALMGITGALLPGIPVFFGILQEMSGASGLAHFWHAGAICLGIGAGIALGAYLAGLGTRAAGSARWGARTSELTRHSGERPGVRSE